MEREGYTIEELAGLSGYSVGTLYNLTTYGALSPPIIGIGGNFGNKGCYLPKVLKELARYKELKLQGLKRDEIIRMMKLERANVQVLEGGRQEHLEANREL